MGISRSLNPSGGPFTLDSQSSPNAQYKKIKALHQHATILAKTQKIEEIAEHTIDAMENTLGFFWASFSIVEDNHLITVLRSQSGTRSRDDLSHLPINGPGITSRAARTGKPQLVADTRKDVDYIGVLMDDKTLYKLNEDLREVILHERKIGGKAWASLSELDVPVKIDDTVVALLSAESTDLDTFNEQDQELLETLASHVASAIQRIKNKEEMRKLAYRLNNLEPGGCYISESHERCLKAYAVLSMEEVPGLCIIREDPQRLIDYYGIKKKEIVILSSRPFREFEAVGDLQSVSITLSEFLESGEGVVLFDGLEYLISRFGFDSVYRFVQEKRFDFLESEAVLLVPLEMKTLNEQERALLSSEFTLLE